MKKLHYAIIGIAIISISAITFSYSIPDSVNTISAQMVENMQVSGMTQMMNQIPEDVIIKVHSSQIVYVGEKAEILLQVLDKNSKLPLDNVTVLVGIEKGASMTTMEMQDGMHNAIAKGEGHYLVRFTPTEEGIYTLHVHVIPEGKTMHSMMQNHMDIGLISKTV